MCAHEIKANGGFQISFFKTCHLKRECVEGSLSGWAPPTTRPIDEIIGYEAVSTPALTVPQSEQEDGTDFLVGTPEDGVVNKHENAAALPMDCFPEKTGKCKPLDTHAVKTVLSQVSAAYGRVGEDLQFEISALVLQLQELLTVDPNKSKTVISHSGYSVKQPNQSLISSQPKGRLMPQHEIRSKNASKNVNRLIQNLGMKQVVVRNEAVEVELNGRNVTHCSFCKEESHAFTTCPNREAFKMNAQEYILSSNLKFATNQQALRSRIGSMPHSLAQKVEGLSYLSRLDKTQLRSNFVLHEARIMVDKTMYYHVSFLNEHAQPGEKSWISWDVMNTIITHSNVKRKFVFDKTITHKQGWIHQNVSASSVGLLGVASVSNDGNAVLSFHDTSKRKSPSSSSVVTDKPQHEQEASKPSTPKRLYRVASEKEQASSKPS